MGGVTGNSQTLLFCAAISGHKDAPGDPFLPKVKGHVSGGVRSRGTSPAAIRFEVRGSWRAFGDGSDHLR